MLRRARIAMALDATVKSFRRVSVKRVVDRVTKDDGVADAVTKAPTQKKPRKNEKDRVKRNAPEHWQEIVSILKTLKEDRAKNGAEDVGCAVHIYNEDKYPPHVWRFQMLVLGMISSLTKDRINGEAVGRLIDREEGKIRLTVQAMIDIDEEKLAQLIYPAGLYRNKAKHIKRTAEILKQRAEDQASDVVDIPETYQEVIKLPGVGPKIANLVMDIAWHNVQGVCVDSHVHRISNRLKWVDTWNHQNPKVQHTTKTQQELEDWLPHEHWGPINVELVTFGQKFCTARAPKCTECPLKKFCPSSKGDKIVIYTEAIPH